MDEAKLGIFVDAENIARNGGYGMQYDILRQFGCRNGGLLLRQNVYLAIDRERLRTDPTYRRTLEYHSILRDLGFKVNEKPVQWHMDALGERYGKANADLDMAVDLLLQSENLDQILLVTGDGDFINVVRALQNKGCRVEVLGFQNVSRDLRREADFFISGYIIPGLLPVETSEQQWGEVGSRVRGVCYSWTEKKYGFIRFLKEVSPNLWITDTRHPMSPYQSVFVLETDLPVDCDINRLPSRDIVFEFDLDENEKGLIAREVRLVHVY